MTKRTAALLPIISIALMVAWLPAPPLNAASTVVYRVNTGGPDVQAAPAWSADTQASPSPYVNAPESTNSNELAIDMSDPSVPSGTPMALFQSERWDGPAAPEMQWNFPVTAGSYEVRLGFAEIYSGAQSVGARVFDVSIENTTVLDNYDVFGDVGGTRPSSSLSSSRPTTQTSILISRTLSRTLPSRASRSLPPDRPANSPLRQRA
jgi:hypothetical protein